MPLVDRGGLRGDSASAERQQPWERGDCCEGAAVALLFVRRRLRSRPAGLALTDDAGAGAQGEVGPQRWTGSDPRT